MKKIDWVFWIDIEKRKGWSNKFQYSRGSNNLDIQILNYRVSIGMPWLKSVIEKADINYPLAGTEYFEKVNESNRLGVKTLGRFRFMGWKL